MSTAASVLPEGWEMKKLGEVCEIINGSTPLRTNKDFWENGDFPWFTIDDIRAQGRTITNTKQKVTRSALSKLRVLPIDTVLLCCTASVGEFAISKIELTTNQQFNGLVVKDKTQLNPEFLMHFCSTLKEQLLGLSGKTTIDFIAISKIKSLEIPLPPLPEQQRLVALLERCFAAINRAKALAEQNLQNARVLFESYLNSLQAEKVDLGGLVDIKTGKLNSNAAVENGKYPFFTCSRDVYAIDNYAFDLEAILLAGNNASGDFNVKHYKGKFNAYQRTYVITVNEEKKILYRYLYFQLLKSLKEFKEMSVGANTKFLKLGMIQGLKIALPSIEEQQTIVRQLDALRAETQKLEAVYQKKLADLEELKKSVLEKAFRGEL